MQYNKRFLLQDIITVVLVSHFLLLAIFFVCDSGALTPERFVINAQKVQSTVVFVPLKKRIEQKKVLDHQGQKQSVGTSAVINYDKYQKKLEKNAQNIQKLLDAPSQKIVVTQSVISPVVPKKVQKIEPKKIAVTSVAFDTIKKSAGKKIAEKVIVKKESKKIIPSKPKEIAKVVPIKKIVQPAKKIEPVKKTIEPIVEKIIPTLPIIEEQIITPVVQEQVVEKVVDEMTKIIDPVAKHDVSETVVEHHVQDDESLKDVTFVGSYDLEMLEIQEHIKTQVAQYYKPPVGISKKAVCELSVIIGAAGKAQRVTVKKSSGSMANDMCARAALLKITFPKRVIGKEIIVELGQ